MADPTAPKVILIRLIDRLAAKQFTADRDPAIEAALKVLRRG